MQQQQHPTWVGVWCSGVMSGTVTAGEEWLKGSCHCGDVAFEVLVAQPIDVYKCKCSICWMKQNHHFVVPHQKLRLLGNANLENLLDEYTFGTGAAKHYAYKICNICAFYQPRSNPHGFGITIYCMERYKGNPNQPNRLQVNFHEFDGIHWEESIQTSSIVAKSEVR